MERAAAHLEYCTAHVRMHALTDVARWTPQEILASFLTLREPAIGLEEWCERAGIQLDTPRIETPDDLTPEQKAAVNASAVHSLRAFSAASNG